MKKTTRNVALTMAFSVCSASCMLPHPALTSTQQEQQRQAIQRVMENLQGAQGYGASGQIPADSTPAEPQMSEAELQQRMESLPAREGGVEFTKIPEGFEADGRLYLDPEGEIDTFAYDSKTGNVCYLVGHGGADFLLKFLRVQQGAEPILLAKAKKQGDTWSVRTVTGKQLRGSVLVPTSSGFVVSRETAAFRYSPGEGIKSFQPPDGYHIAKFQNGDVASTGYILLERDEDKDTVNGLIGGIQGLGSSVGIGKKEDYMLMHLETGKTVMVNVGSAGKKDTKYTDCTRTGTLNSTLNIYSTECRGRYRYETLYKEDGNRNFTHYFWRITWLNTKGGPLAIVNENSTRKITVTNLETGEQTVVYRNPLVITGFEARQDAQGTVSLTILTTLDIKAKTIPDLEAHIASIKTKAAGGEVHAGM